jgi:tRNA-(ms[2]io[6]A)-hydroxylase
MKETASAPAGPPAALHTSTQLTGAQLTGTQLTGIQPAPAEPVAGVDLQPLRAFLGEPTPDAWVQCAADPAQQALLLIDHANCEKKAASTALNLIYRYVDNYPLLHKLSRLAREELRHFEQVIAIMEQRGIRYATVSASRYAGALRAEVRGGEPQRLLDTLLVGAIIEARSCERFAALAPHLDAELAHFYRSLLKSEARHFEDYLQLAAPLLCADALQARLTELLAVENALILEPDPQFRFHSGVPCTG